VKGKNNPFPGKINYLKEPLNRKAGEYGFIVCPEDMRFEEPNYRYSVLWSKNRSLVKMFSNSGFLEY